MKQDNKTKKPKKNVPQKKNKLDWQKFNFLENLLIFCTVPNRIAPPESGVSFRITKPEKDSVCILFKTDRREDPLVTNQKQKRPDYLSLFIQNGLLGLGIAEGLFVRRCVGWHTEVLAGPGAHVDLLAAFTAERAVGIAGRIKTVAAAGRAGHEFGSCGL